MATKRSFSDIHPSRRDQVTQPARKRQKPDNLGAKSFKKAHPVNDLKNRIRNLTRLLSREDDKLPAHIRVAKERELQTTQHELDESIAADRKSKLVGRYHKVRFFDRQKAERRLKQAKKALREAATESDEQKAQQLRQDVEEYGVDISYAQYYPLDKPYVSLYPKSMASQDTKLEAESVESSPSAIARKGDPAMRTLIRECMVNGKLDDLRNGKLNDTEAQRPAQSVAPARLKVRTGPAQKAKATKQTVSTTIQTQSNSDGEESDGGFFE